VNQYMRVLLDGKEAYLPYLLEQLADHRTGHVVGSRQVPVLPDGEWVEVTTIDSEVPEYALWRNYDAA